ncbi:MAG: hypothetical protein Q8Q07_09020 [Dehalococcoidales bacterium]|nr:hypothetical protein [Dehalococcoidales bacterium]
MTETNGLEDVLEREVRASLTDDHLPCAAAFQIAGKAGVSRRQVGDMANQIRARIIDCQLGCFKFEKAVHDLDSIKLNPELAEKVSASLENGRLTCTRAFEVAKESKVAPRTVADTANKLKIKIHDCQLGCF